MRLLLLLLLLSGLFAHAQEDYGACVGPAPGTIAGLSFNAWSCERGGGPSGADCIVSGPTPEPWDTSTVELSVSGPGLVSFHWQCSSAPGDWLTLEVQVPGGFMEVTGISGEQDWHRMEVLVPAGAKKVRWTYRNFATGNEGADSGRVAQVQWTPYTDAAVQNFEDWKAAQGVTPDASHGISGLRLDTCYVTGIGVQDSVPPGALTPLIEGGELKMRVPLFKRSGGVLRVEHSDDAAAWSHYGVKCRLVPGTEGGSNVLMEYSVPAGSGKKFLRCRNTPFVTPPDGFAFIPEGTFTMCSPLTENGRAAQNPNGVIHSDEDYRHQVTLTRSFFLRKYETTFDEFIATQTWARANGYPRLAIKTNSGFDEDMAQNGFTGPDGRDDSGPHPVVDVNWHETIKWLNAKSEREGLTPCYYVRLRTGAVEIYRQQNLETEVANDVSAIIFKREANGWRLPTEAEWEYACRAGTESALSNGQELMFPEPGSPLDEALNPLGWYVANSGGGTHPVGKKKANPFNLYDMYGNAGEWTWDSYSSILILKFPKDPVTDPPVWLPNGSIYRTYRGGGWKLSAKWHRSASRLWVIPFLQGGGQVGFRYCRNSG